MQKLCLICKKYANDVQKAYAICSEFNMQNVQYICKIYAKYAVYANHATNVQNMHLGLC